MLEHAPGLASAEGIAALSKPLLAFFGDKTCAQIRTSTCKAYAAWRRDQPLRQATTEAAMKKRVSVAGARRGLEDLSAALSCYHGEHPFVSKPTVWLSEKPAVPATPCAAPRLRDCSRRLGAGANRRPGRGSACATPGPRTAHLPRFLLVGFYTGTRPGLIPRVHWIETTTSPYVYLDKGIMYRRGKDKRESPTTRKPMVKVPPRLVAHMPRRRELDLKEQKRRQDADPTAPPINTLLHHSGRPITGRIRRSFRNTATEARLGVPATPHLDAAHRGDLADGGRLRPLDRGGLSRDDGADPGEVLRPPPADHQADAHPALSRPRSA